MLYRPAAVAALLLVLPSIVSAQQTLPAPSAYPLAIDFAGDPILQLQDEHVEPEVFRRAIAAAVLEHPGLAEAKALEDEAEALLDQARDARLPSVDASLTSYRVLSRDFSDDPQNIIERSRPEQRTDAILQIQQTVLDFGAGARRQRAAGARLREAAADVEVSSDRIALSLIAAWYDVFGERALVGLTQAFTTSQQELRVSVGERVRAGVSAEGDLARVDSYIAQAQSRLAIFQRLLANAEARFAELTGYPPPPDLGRGTEPALFHESLEATVFAARATPAVESAEAAAQAAQLDALAARADRLPQVTTGIDSGRYGVFENDRDYDIRARVTVRQRLFGGIDSRASQYAARARAAEARAERIREEASRDASIAWADVRALEQQLQALQEAYIASRRSRDVIVERFRAARGTLFDVLAAEDAFFETATAYVQALSELDASRYVLLSRTGRLLESMDVEIAGGAADER